MKLNWRKNLLKTIWLLFLLLFSAIILYSWQSLAVSACSETIGGVCIPSGTGLSVTPANTIIATALRWILGIFGALAIISFVISGIQYLVSAGNDDMVKTAKRNMTYSIVGVAVALAGFVIIKAIDTALRATSTSF